MEATKEYHKLLRYILENGKDKGDRTGTGTKSIFDYKIKFDMSEGFPLITTKKIHTRSVIHELLWFLKGDTNTKYLNDNGVTIWDEWVDDDGNLGPLYGSQWVNWQGFQQGWNTMADTEYPEEFETTGINQIQNAIDALRNNPDSRRIMVSAWNVGEIDKMALPPCHWAFELYTEELTMDERVDLLKVEYGKEYKGISFEECYFNQKYDIGFDHYTIPERRLHLKWHQRSVDTFLGLPFNISSYALLLHMFAQQTNMVPGTLVGDLTNVHIYDNHIDYVKEQLDRAYSRYYAPTLKINQLKCTDEEPGSISSTFVDKNMFEYEFEDFEIENYQYFPNWKNVPIAV